jgi:hypothetical protein
VLIEKDPEEHKLATAQLYPSHGIQRKPGLLWALAQISIWQVLIAFAQKKIQFSIRQMK